MCGRALRPKSAADDGLRLSLIILAEGHKHAISPIYSGNNMSPRVMSLGAMIYFAVVFCAEIARCAAAGIAIEAAYEAAVPK